MATTTGRVLLTGATGFIGGRLLPVLDAAGHAVRCLVRPGEKLVLRRPMTRKPEIVSADLLDPDALPAALAGTSTAFYLVHSMGGRRPQDAAAFADRDRRAATNFLAAAEAAGVARIVYLGGLGEDREALSEHLRSRHEVARILGSSPRVALTTLRAAVIIGAGGASFEIIRHLVERLPVMLVPRWIDTRCQPIAVEDVTSYLAGCLGEERTAGLSLDIGGPDILTYRTLMLIYARVRGLRRIVVPVPMMSPHLSAYWIDLITPVPAGIVMPLVEGLRNEVICRENRIRELLPIRLTPMKEAICSSLADEQGGPGQLPSRQACFLD